MEDNSHGQFLKIPIIALQEQFFSGIYRNCKVGGGFPRGAAAENADRVFVEKD